MWSLRLTGFGRLDLIELDRAIRSLLWLDIIKLHRRIIAYIAAIVK